MISSVISSRYSTTTTMSGCSTADRKGKVNLSSNCTYSSTLTTGNNVNYSTKESLSVPVNTRYGVAFHFLISSLHQPSKLHVLYTCILSDFGHLTFVGGCNPLSLFVLQPSAILLRTCLIAKYSDSSIIASYIHNNWERAGHTTRLVRHQHSTSYAI